MDRMKIHDELLAMMEKLRENAACLQIHTGLIKDLLDRVYAAGNQMALGLGQNPDAEPLPAVAEFLDQLRIGNETLTEILATVRMMGENDTAIAESVLQSMRELLNR